MYPFEIKVDLREGKEYLVVYDPSVMVNLVDEGFCPVYMKRKPICWYYLLTPDLLRSKYII